MVMSKGVNLKLAFKVRNKNTSKIGKLICFFTRSRFYHVELIIDDLWVSADHPYGVTIYKLRPLNHEDWEYVDLGITKVFQEDYETIMSFISKQKSKKYDYLAIFFSQLIPLNIHSNNRVFCSEFVTSILKLFLEEKALPLHPNTVSPKELARLYGLKEK